MFLPHSFTRVNPPFWRAVASFRFYGLFLLFLFVSAFSCQTVSRPTTTGDDKPAVYGYEVVRAFPHDPNAFTQGLVIQDGKFLESTGEVGRSSLRRVEIDTGSVVQRVEVPTPYFAEGITLLKGKIYQLTWQHKLGFVYDAFTFQQLGKFNYEGEGWGLANDGTLLILSDGSNHIRFLDPDNFQVKRTIAVVSGHTPVNEINELEYVQGEIYANIWHDNRIARINPQSGAVTGWVDLRGLLAPGEATDEEAVLNGIAYDEASGRLFVTGKLWPKLFEIRLTKK